VRGARVEKNFSKLTSFSGGHAGHGGRKPAQRPGYASQRGTVTPEEALHAGAPVPAPRCTASTASASPTMRPWHSKYATILASCLPVGRCGWRSSLYVALERAGNRPVRGACSACRAVLFSAEGRRKLLQAQGA